MKRDPDFWFFLAGIAALISMFAIALTYKFNFFSEWFLAFSLLILIVSVGYIGVTLFTLYTRRKNTALISQAVPGRHAQSTPSWHKRANVLRSVCLGGMVALLQLPSDAGFLRDAGGSFLLVVFGVWIWYELVGSKREEIGR